MNTLKTKSTNDKNLSKLAVNKSLLKEYKTSEGTRTVYLNDGDEFQIQLFNPETTEIGAEIFIDDEKLSNIIILNPGERMWLERYTDKAKKFRFRVYTVDGDSKAVKQAIAHNGEIKIKFYRKQKPIEVHTYHSPTYIYYDHYNWEPIKPWQTIYSSTTANDASVVFTSSSTKASNANSSRPIDIRNVKLGPNPCIDSINTLYSSTLDCGISAASASTLSIKPEPAAFQYTEYDNGCSCASIDSSLNTDLIETGRVAEGSHSNQKFESVDINLEYCPFKTEEFKILPYSRKPYTVNDAKKLYCPHCGRKLNTKFNFCPYCGEKID